MSESLLSLFLPPEGFFGDFGMICGFTSSSDVLKAIKSNFSAEMSRPALVTFIHPAKGPVSGIPGLVQAFPKTLPLPYRLLHAKVALLGFRDREGSYRIRLIVTTGNWTRDPLTTSIDLFWSITLDPKDPGAEDAADIRAAWGFFDTLKADFDCSLIEREYDGRHPNDQLSHWIEELPDTEEPRFIHSRKRALLPQIVDQMKPRKRKATLIIGSGFFEGGDGRKSTVPERFHKGLENKNKVASTLERVLVLNPTSCQGMATAAKRLQEDGWSLCVPRSALHPALSLCKLHAKFALLATGTRWREKFSGSLYMGSGNMTPAGIENKAGKAGNLEAGVVLQLGSELSYGPGRKMHIRNALPLGGDEIEVDAFLGAGERFEEPEPPETLPEVPYLIWEREELSAPEEREIRVIGPDGAEVLTPCGWPAPAPVHVRLVTGGYEVPVIADGVLVVPQPQDISVEDMLAELRHFPEPEERDPYDVDDDEGDQKKRTTEGRTTAASPSRYPLRRMMSLLVPLAENQKTIHELDWPRWCRELQSRLIALKSREEAMIKFFREAGADPLPILLHRGLCPSGIDPDLLAAALAKVAEEWGLLPDTPSLWDRDEPHHER
ncbi:hypothetical protein KM176_23895 [Pseudooceanicola sp. CBS1P-1]|uniref:Uncharacterized protein n=1 Tax=Pseudooceanicola albus TaxID=2692189 RepID=A0A6L7GCT5_9RHOB|nr:MULTISPECIES: hypothetical protein [Pseudooceanicola]MBT9386906.1 hypothetical protein [Pseudooceanicola endophyticus]MXN21040.1 hypothetical protein [Pseudooceanicola albus]